MLQKSSPASFLRIVMYAKRLHVRVPSSISSIFAPEKLCTIDTHLYHSTMKEEQCARDGLLRNSFEKSFF